VVSPDGVASSRMVSVSASVNLPLHHKVQKFSSGTGSPGWSRKMGRKTVVVVVVTGGRSSAAWHSVPAVSSAPHVHARRRDDESRPENFQQFIKHERRCRFPVGLLWRDSAL